MTPEEKFLAAAQELAAEAHAMHERGEKLTDNHIMAVALTNKDRYEVMVRLKED